MWLMFYSWCIVYCFQTEKNMMPFEHLPRQPIMEVWSFCAAVCLRVSLLWLVFQRKQGTLISSAEGGTVSLFVVIGWHWAFMIGRECCGRGGRERKERHQGRGESPKGTQSGGKNRVQSMCTKACWSHVTFNLSAFTGRSVTQHAWIFIMQFYS